MGVIPYLTHSSTLDSELINSLFFCCFFVFCLIDLLCDFRKAIPHLWASVASLTQRQFFIKS